MNRARSPKKTKSPTNFSPDDIPLAQRDSPTQSGSANLQPLLIGGLVAFFALLGILTAALLPNRSQSSSQTASSSTPAPTENAANPQASPTADDAAKDDLLGHYAYTEAPASDLKPITADGRFQLRIAAAEKYLAMVDVARRSGIILTTISGYRSIEEQEQLFFEIGAQRGQEPSQRANVSAPPGYSEHHTGYAVDIGDGRVPATNLSVNFENTQAFQWLQANAARFGFELSFPRDNEQGISYEPWHWRFVGDRESLETFYQQPDAPVAAPVQSSRQPDEQIQ